MSEAKPVARPLSPHLQVYRFTLTMALSIVHRITGAALYLGMLLLVWWLTAAATSDSAFAFAQAFMGSWFGQLILFGFTWALIMHALNGIRHLVWDIGRGFDLKTIEWSARAAVIGSVVLSIALWIIAYGVRP